MSSLTESNNSIYDSLQGWSSSQSVRQISRTAPHDDFLTFISIAQKYNVDFVATTWQPGFGLLGQGGYGRVSQSLVNLQFSFAFKRIREVSDTFKEPITELSVLCQPFIRDHPNIIKLEGICWEVNPEADRILPVLLFEKSREGDLRHFLSSAEGRGLSVMAKLGLCADIAEALINLHDSRMSFLISFLSYVILTDFH